MENTTLSLTYELGLRVVYDILIIIYIPINPRQRRDKMRFFDLNDPKNVEETLPEQAYRMVKAMKDKEVDRGDIEDRFTREEIALVEELKDVISLRDKGDISRREFRARRKKILKKMMK